MGGWLQSTNVDKVWVSVRRLKHKARDSPSSRCTNPSIHQVLSTKLVREIPVRRMDPHAVKPGTKDAVPSGRSVHLHMPPDLFYRKRAWHGYGRDVLSSVVGSGIRLGAAKG